MITDKWVFICSPPRSASTFCTWLLQGEGVFVTDEQNWLLSMYDIFQFWVQKRNEGFEPNDARIMFGDKKYHFGLLNNACLKSPEAGAYSIALGLRQLHGNPEWFGDKYPWYAIIRNWQKLWKILLDGAYYLGRSAEIRFIVCLRDYSDTKQSFKLLLENQNESIEDYEMHLKRAYHGAHELLNIHQKETLFIDFKEFKEDWQKTGNKMRQWLQLDTIQYPEPPSWAYSVNSKKKIPITYNELSNNTKQAPYTKSNLKSNSMKPLSSNGMGKPDIVLTICPPWDVITPPLGLGYIMAYLKSQDINAKLIDLNILLWFNHDVFPETMAKW